ncbi:MAG: helix-turn-helix domain-containing protein [Alphaproteobacteria bacterium]|nr:helix-turn-helix domain-containing protein [Alphaproteobacteria bacterium]
MHKKHNIAERLAQRLKEARKSKGLSLEAMAKLSGVSRSMLSQIERGQSSPTVATLWSLTQALRVDFAGLLDDQTASRSIREILRANRTPTIDSQGEGCRIRILSPPAQAGRLEVYEISFTADAALLPHQSGCHEDLTVLEGSLEVVSGDETEQVFEGDTIRYAADCPHQIRAIGLSAKAILIVHGS